MKLFSVLVVSLGIGVSLALDAEALDMSRVPFLSEHDKELLEKDYKSAKRACQSSYAVAVSRSGGWGAMCGGSKRPEDDVRRTALEKCEHTAGESCGIVVKGGQVVDFTESPPQMSYPETFTASEVPFVSTKARKRLRKDYEKALAFKALAITRNGTYGFSRNASTQAQAKRKALKRCEKYDRKRGRCFIYSVGSEVVFDTSTEIFPKRAKK